MLKKETLTKIATLLKVKETDLETAIKDEKEVDVEIDSTLGSFTDKELKKLKSNSYNEGKEAGIEMEVDEIKKSEGLEFTGKSVKSLLEAKAAKVLEDAKIEPNKKVEALEKQVGTLKVSVQDFETKLKEKDSEVETVKLKSEVYKHIPAAGENGPALGQDDVFQLMISNGLTPKLENGKTVFYKGDQRVNDKLGDPVAANEVIKGFMTEKKLIVEAVIPGGRGGGDKGGGTKAGKLSELKAQFTTEGKSLLGEEFSKAAQEAAKDKDFDMNG